MIIQYGCRSTSSRWMPSVEGIKIIKIITELKNLKNALKQQNAALSCARVRKQEVEVNNDVSICEFNHSYSLCWKNMLQLPYGSLIEDCLSCHCVFESSAPGKLEPPKTEASEHHYCSGKRHQNVFLMITWLILKSQAWHLRLKRRCWFGWSSYLRLPWFPFWKGQDEHKNKYKRKTNMLQSSKSIMLTDIFVLHLFIFS